ncbi:hypothetical protein CIG75_16555 [Tumebacillus algifaecis]|uniref:Uncharacterized protein n=1 Tax=Tumebacillus algifaecis TaxID=1214604 RepID=A0A223D4Q1_9BACL|nr:hypothetical protein [Tumebacillus algifaecis]ASS76406.1 hypothetical protein CIG75_16555 [Tumebacillus algifaecis]
MTEQQWKHLKNDLKQLKPDEQDQPADAMQFKNKVLQEYDRRTRVQQRSRWFRRVTTALTIAVAVWCGLLITSPFSEEGLVAVPEWKTLSQPKSNQGVQGLAPYDVVSSYFDFLLQRRTEDANALLVDDMREQESVVTQNLSDPHMTGFTIYNASKGSGKIQYSVRVSWGSKTEKASSEAYEVTVTDSVGRWLIAEIKRSGEVVFDGSDGLEISRTQRGKTETFLRKSDWSEAGRWTLFAADPSFSSQLVFVDPEEAPVIYKAAVGMKPQQLVELPKGEAKAVFWTDTNLLAVNFTAAESKKSEVLFYDAIDGKMRDSGWLGGMLRMLGADEYEALHALPNERIRVAAGEGRYLLDLKNRMLSPDHSLGQVAKVKFDVQNVELPVEGLVFSYPDRTPEFLDTVDVISSDQKVDLRKETGFYVFNGIFSDYSLKGSELQVHLKREKGRVQVVTVPYGMLKQFAGQQFVVKVFDEGGKLLADPYEVEVPK